VFDTPAAYGFPHATWRPYQADIIGAMERTPDGESLMISSPTGTGKSLCYMARALTHKEPTLILTSSRGLQDQLMRDFESLGLVDLRGRRNYTCAVNGGTCDMGPCTRGKTCTIKDKCEHAVAVRRAKQARIVVTNYHCIVSRAVQGSSDLGARWVVCDEAHSLPDVLRSCFSIRISEPDLQAVAWNYPLPKNDSAQEWKNWARVALQELSGADDQWSANMRARLRVLGFLDDTWFFRRDNGVHFRPVHAGSLFRYVLSGWSRGCLFTSATLTPDVVQELDVPSYFCEYPSPFPVGNRPVLRVPTVRVQYNMSKADSEKWLGRIAEIVDLHCVQLGQKGIVHSVSYDRTRAIAERLYDMVDVAAPSSGDRNTWEVRRFKQARHPMVLISPAITVGWDFPGEECEFQVMAKVPFPSKGDAYTKLLSRRIPNYGARKAAQGMVQAAGRGVRSESDICTMYVIDDNFGWFYTKNRRYFPKFFQDACMTHALFS